MIEQLFDDELFGLFVVKQVKKRVKKLTATEEKLVIGRLGKVG